MEMEPITDEQDYKSISELFQENLRKVHAGYEGRFVNIVERRDTRDQNIDKGYSKGKVVTHWRGLALRKYPVDYVIIQQLLWELKPATVFEMGAHEGGSALWMADTLKSYGCNSHVYSVDIDMNIVRALAKESDDITFVHGDLKHVEQVLPAQMLQQRPHPWFFIEDSHVNLVAILDHFHKFFQTGDYLCIEDTSPFIPRIEDSRLLRDEQGVSKLSTLRHWLEKNSDKYAIDEFYTDFYGYNETGNWNGYVKRL